MRYTVFSSDSAWTVPFTASPTMPMAREKKSFLPPPLSKWAVSRSFGLSPPPSSSFSCSRSSGSLLSRNSVGQSFSPVAAMRTSLSVDITAFRTTRIIASASCCSCLNSDCPSSNSSWNFRAVSSAFCSWLCISSN